MFINIKTLRNNVIFFDNLTGDNTVYELKKQIENYEGISVENQRLIYNGKLLEDNMCLKEHDIYEKLNDSHNVSNYFLHLVLKL